MSPAINDHDLTPSYQPPPPDGLATPMPMAIGRYLVQAVLGHGGFGIVYLARDERLQRQVAIKVPHSKNLLKPHDVEAYLSEARMVASLDHPNIVPVHDVGSTEEFPCYIVSKFIEGSTLSKRIHEAPLSIAQTAELIATVAETLHYAHRKGLVHRDVKPGNILLDAAGKPYVADFGLALKEENLGRGPTFAGTPNYMSPEQARSEGHRVDGRSDIFSLGVVLYELMTGRRPFRADSRSELLEQIIGLEARPPRQIDDHIPKELERICLKAMSKRAAERYTTAKDMADDLRAFLKQAAGVEKLAGRPAPVASDASGAQPTPTPATGRSTPGSNQETIRIVPKGLRSFDANDTDFFLELLPGPRDREGLPDSIRFWKSRAEEFDPENTFSVGMIYGPSGCGKSSTVKAGLLPRLAGEVNAVYVEATAHETENRLLTALRKRCPDLGDDLSLKESFLFLRRGQGMPAAGKVLVVLDQFEQWLHNWNGDETAELVQALRHCDGGRMQCLVLVRDDFWLAVSRFFQALEVDLIPGRNIALVDLFDLDHARKVLAGFGSAYGKLPERFEDWTREQKDFLKQVVVDLSQDGKVICVRLALFAEMMKGRPWTPAAVKEVGGTEGIGVRFLEDTFSSPAANPKHRLHQKAVRAVLKELLPETGSDIKGNMRSEAELLAASGYGDRPRDFEELVRILDGEVRLITPTDPAGSVQEGDGASAGAPGERYYQLTHDYMVHSLRDWLTRKQRETRQGRAELRLSERAAVWNSRPERRNLPSFIEWAKIRLLTSRRTWTATQRKMMAAARRYHLGRFLILALGLGLIGLGVSEYRAQSQAQELRKRLADADIGNVPSILEEMQPYERRVAPLLREALESEADPKRRLQLSLGLVQTDRDQVPFLLERLLQAAPQDFAVIRQVLAPFKDEILGQLWREFDERGRDSGRGFRAACALIEYASEDARWFECSTAVVEGLLLESPFALSHWKTALESVRMRLLPALAESLEDSTWTSAERRAIVDFYREFSLGDSNSLQPLEVRMALDHPELDATELSKRKAVVGAALVALGKGEAVWPLLVHTHDPTLRSYLIERLGTMGVDPSILYAQLQRERDVSVRRALILALGGIKADRAVGLIPVLTDLYENDPDPGIHGAAGWTLRRWNQVELLRASDAKLAAAASRSGHRWYMNNHLQTFSIVEGRQLESGKARDSLPANDRFAIGTTEVTISQFLMFRPQHQVDTTTTASQTSCPVNNVTWHDAAEYCNWLSKEERLGDDQLCYYRKQDGSFEFFADYLSRKGYRMPTKQEWQIACKAGATTQWHFGEADSELTSEYAWWLTNSHPQKSHQLFAVGLLKPNDLGLFDMHGNAIELCQEKPNSKTVTFGSDIDTVLLGGSYYSTIRTLSCEQIAIMSRKHPLPNVSFRVARSIP